jgi:hypothetical protein
MAITSRQFDQLSEMGISLWQHRNLNSQATISKQQYAPQNQQSLDNLAKKTIFNDILLSLNLTIGEVNVQDNHLDVGMFNWYFIYDDTEQANRVDTDNIMYSESKLITPNIETIAQSAILKKQLWHTITKNLL